MPVTTPHVAGAMRRAGRRCGVARHRVQPDAYRTERRRSGAVGTALPAATTLLAHAAWRCNNATALAVGLDINSVYVETDN